MKNKPTVVIGASTNPDRYAYKAIKSLVSKGQKVYAEGLKEGSVDSVSISKDRLIYNDIHTITLYVGPKNQPNWYDYILSLKPKRIVFNPGTENDELVELAHKNKIETVEACTLVMLSIGNY